MNGWYVLRRVLESPKSYADITKTEICYEPSVRRMESFQTSKTGWIEEQFVSNQNKHTYLPVLYDGNVYLVSKQATEQTVILGSIEGYQNGIVTLRKFARLFGNEDLYAEGVILDEETIGVLSHLPKKYQTIKGAVYWTAIKHCEIERSPFLAKYGFYCMTPEGKKHETLYEHGGRYGKEGKLVSASIRPIIRLHPGTMVNLEGKRGEPLEIMLG